MLKGPLLRLPFTDLNRRFDLAQAWITSKSVWKGSAVYLIVFKYNSVYCAILFNLLLLSLHNSTNVREDIFAIRIRRTSC